MLLLVLLLVRLLLLQPVRQLLWIQETLLQVVVVRLPLLETLQLG